MKRGGGAAEAPSGAPLRLGSGPTAAEGLPCSFPPPHLLLVAGSPSQPSPTNAKAPRRPLPRPPAGGGRRQARRGAGPGGAWPFRCATARAANGEFAVPRDRAGEANGRRGRQEAGFECVRGTEGASVSGAAPASPSASPPVRRRSALESQRRAERAGAGGDRRRSGARGPSGHPPAASQGRTEREERRGDGGARVGDGGPAAGARAAAAAGKGGAEPSRPRAGRPGEISGDAGALLPAGCFGVPVLRTTELRFLRALRAEGRQRSGAALEGAARFPNGAAIRRIHSARRVGAGMSASEPSCPAGSSSAPARGSELRSPLQGAWQSRS